MTRDHAMPRLRLALLAAAAVLLSIHAAPAGAQVAFKLGATQADDGRAIAVDASGNTYVTGRFRLTVDFDPGPGTFDLTTSGGFSRYVASYDPTGALRYALKIDGASLPEAGIAVDGFGNVYVTGAFSGNIDFDPAGTTHTLSSADGRIFVASYDGSGGLRFAINFGLLTATLERGTGIVVDAAGNSYVTGAFNGEADFDPTPVGDLLVQSNGITDAFLASYTGSGIVRFAIGIGGIFADEGYDIAIDSSNNLYIAGSFRDTVDFDPGVAQASFTSAGAEDIFLASYTSTGAFRYAVAAGDTSTDRGSAVAVDSLGNAYLTGEFVGTADFDPGAGVAQLTSNGNNDIVLASYDATGALRFAYGFGDITPDQGFGAAVDAMDNVYITGGFRNTIDFDPGPGDQSIGVFGTAAFVASYTNTGAYREAYEFSRIGTGSALGRGIAVDGAGRPSVIGEFDGTVDFDPSAGTSTLTSSGSSDMFLSSFFPGVLGPGNVPMASLRVTRTVDRNVLLEWAASCSLASVDYAIYEGELGNWYSHDAETCTTGEALQWEVGAEAGDRYWLVVPLIPGEEGSYGTSSDGMQRSVGINTCRPVLVTETCP